MGSSNNTIKKYSTNSEWLFSRKHVSEVRVSMKPTKKNEKIMDMLETVKRGYDAVSFLRNRHVATILPTLFRKDVLVEYQRELLRMECGGVVALDWPLSVDDETHKYRERTP